ncbi:Pkinase domain-containing protein [Cephalotus follicularis]|uniref:Pkinase domain-containing protein n=1 Tax=Cephalotus follicularis TaxID=3775 RepID=A0A1Q3BJU0_CEPFO|nr:Pkinase domain-containing protein [Cephalotus follicularis]
MKQKGLSHVVVGKAVVVAVKASKEIPRTALVWALTHVAQPGDCIRLLVVIPAHLSSKRIWSFSRFTSDCSSGHRGSLSGTSLDQKDDIADSCFQMMLHLQDFYDPDKVKVRLKIVSSSPCGVVAAEAKRFQSNWVILDKGLRHERKYCMEELQCNVVVMKRSQPKVLRLNLVGSPNIEAEFPDTLTFELDSSPEHLKSKLDESSMIKGPFVTPASSPDHDSVLTGTDIGTSSMSSSDLGTSPFFHPRVYRNLKEYPLITEKKQKHYESDSDTDSEWLNTPSTRSSFQKWMAENFIPSGEISKQLLDSSQRTNDSALTSYEFLLKRLSTLDREPDIEVLNYKMDPNLCRSVREAISLPKNAPPCPPPLCSICQHKAPLFGNPPRWFTYAELELATDGFSKVNFLAEGGFGSVHRGVLPEGQVIAVKQHKLASSQGDQEFCSEVEVLNCAQHRNVVMLIGFCIEDGRRLLVYEYVCNGSLDSHLYGRSNRDPLEWSARQKIAVGAARGLRYLHEECRVGCIVHRDLRPNNILLTHDFEPLVGDFGLARWQPDGDKGVETRVIGTFGYLAPEYAQSGQITEKADVYSFGVVLVELVTGRKAVDINRPKGQQSLTEWARPLLERNAIHELVDPCLRDSYFEQEVYGMLQCASMCIRRNPQSRPRMSQVLRMLEGDIVMTNEQSIKQ